MIQFQNSSKKFLINYTRNIIKDIGITNDIKNHNIEAYKYFTNFLLPRHEDYYNKTKNMKNLGIQYNKFKNYEMYVLNEDNSKNIFSWLHCCNQRSSKLDDLSSAMRNTISSQIGQYKIHNKNLSCSFCNTKEDIHIDHITQFIELQKGFLESTDLLAPKQFNKNDFNSKIFKPEDEDFRREWFVFHLKHSKLRPLCKRCNVKRKKSKVKMKDIKINWKK